MGRPRIKHYFFLLVFVRVLVNHIKGINLVTSATQINELEMSLSPEMEQSLCKDLSLTLAKFPKVRLGHLPTPLEPMDRSISPAIMQIVKAKPTRPKTANLSRIAKEIL